MCFYAIPETKFARKYFPSSVKNRVLFFPEIISIAAVKKKFFSLSGYDIKIQKGNFPAVGINKTLFILFVLFCLCYI